MEIKVLDKMICNHYVEEKSITQKEALHLNISEINFSCISKEWDLLSIVVIGLLSSD